MDGRRWIVSFTVSLLAGCSSLTGSQSPGGLANLPKPKTVLPEAGQSTVSRAMTTARDSKKKEPAKASTFVALAQYREQLGASAELSFAEAEQLRSQVRAAYQEAVRLDPKCTAAYIGLAKTFLEAEDAPQAFAMYQKALEVVPDDANLWFEKGLTHARFKDFDGALASLQRAAQLDPDNRLYARTVGMTLARSGRFDEARAVFAKCMKDEEAHYTLARMYAHLGQADEARREAALALRAKPTFMPAHELVAQLNQPGGVQAVAYEEPAVAPRVQVGGIE
jgi:tetratricopeptide (TPR) repeat protein